MAGKRDMFDVWTVRILTAVAPSAHGGRAAGEHFDHCIDDGWANVVFMGLIKPPPDGVGLKNVAKAMVRLGAAH